MNKERLQGWRIKATSARVLHEQSKRWGKKLSNGGGIRGRCKSLIQKSRNRQRAAYLRKLEKRRFRKDHRDLLRHHDRGLWIWGRCVRHLARRVNKKGRTWSVPCQMGLFSRLEDLKLQHIVGMHRDKKRKKDTASGTKGTGSGRKILTNLERKTGGP